ncbi:MAG: hypothetical protein LBH28_03440, partial [Oscillospiraceae bacterium]|nr:hypothetical protein [Oscillospiraceae bacterium]
MDFEPRKPNPNNYDLAASAGRTEFVEQRIKGGTDFDAASDLIKDHFIQQSIRDYFAQLISRLNIDSAEIISRADLDKDFGRQIVNGERRTRRDNYIRLSIAMGLDSHETQSLLKFVQAGQIYVLRQRDAAIMFCIQKKFSLID